MKNRRTAIELPPLREPAPIALETEKVRAALLELPDWSETAALAVESGLSIPVTQQTLEAMRQEEAVECWEYSERGDRWLMWRLKPTPVAEADSDCCEPTQSDREPALEPEIAPEFAAAAEADLAEFCGQFEQAHQKWQDLAQPEIESSDRSLSDEEERDRLALEQQVDRAFFRAGKALGELRDRRLYRSTHGSFEAYCRERFNLTRRRIYQLIDASVVVENLVELAAADDERAECERAVHSESEDERAECERAVHSENTHMMPTSEYQIRPLVPLDPEQQREAWAKSVAEAKGRPPSHKIVKDVVEQMRSPEPVEPNPFREGEICVFANATYNNAISRLRGLGGCWCVVVQVDGGLCDVKTWEQDLTDIPHKALRSLGWDAEQSEQMARLCDRLRRLLDVAEKETSVRAMFVSLGKEQRPWLTEVEKVLLAALEQQRSRPLRAIRGGKFPNGDRTNNN